MAIDALKTNLEYMKELALELFAKRKIKASQIKHVDNSKLYAGDVMHFYCQHCGIESDVVEEQYLFKPRLVCSQCQGLIEEGWMPK